MKIGNRAGFFALFSLAALLAPAWAAGQATPAVMAYYVGWEQSQMPPSEIDFTALTALIHFSVVPNSDGTLNATSNGLSASNISAAVSATHAAGKKILFTVGGSGSQTAFESAMSSTYQAAFISNLVSFMQSNGYDGIDIDMEPMSTSDETMFVQFATNLRTALNKISPRPMLTTTALWTPATFAAAASQFDQINIMTYSLSGPYSGWFTWHNAPVYSTGYTFPGGGAPPSADTLVKQFTGAGVPSGTLGIGFTMDPYVWSGVSYPGQTWSASNPPTATETAYNTIATTYGIVEYNYTNPEYHWDSNAQAAYLSITSQSPNQFVSYDNEVSAQAKAQYIKTNNLGSLIIWDLQDGHRATQPAGKQDLLLEAIKQAVFGSSTTTTDTTPPTVAITTPSAGASVAGTITVSGTASDNVSVAGVQFKLNGANIGAEVTAPPYSVSWNTTGSVDGLNVLTAVAWDTSGNSSTSTSVSVTVENTPPNISAVSVATITYNSAGITWTTNEVADSQVNYGTSTAYGSLNPQDSTLLTSHDVSLDGLSSSTTYYYQVRSRNAAGVLSTSQGFTFTTPAAPPSVSGSSNTLFDDFSAYTRNVCFPDGSTFGPWTSSFSGYGCTSIGTDGLKDWLQLDPEVSTSSGVTHSALTVGPSFSYPLTYNLNMNTIAQLRQGSPPNAWERGWVLWDYQNNTHFYYLTLKTNGWELGKEDPSYPGDQRFLATGSSPTFSVGVWNAVQVVQNTQNTMSVYVNNQLLTTFTDTLTPYTSGQIGVYSEDSQVQFEDVAVNTQAPLLISGVSVPQTGSNFVVVNWTTNAIGDSQVQYGTSTAYGFLSALNSSPVTAHNVAVSSLSPQTLYHYRALSRASDGYLAASPDFAFMTEAPGSSASLPPAQSGASQADLYAEAKAPQRFLSPALADGINDVATFGLGANDVTIYNLQGRQVFHGSRQGGIPITWNCKNSAGTVIDSGVYIAKIESDESGTVYQSFVIVK